MVNPPETNVTVAWLAFLSSCVVIIPTASNFIIAYWAKKGTDKVAKDVAASSQKTDEQGNKILVLADKTHTLVNSQMGQILMNYAISARTLANLTNKPEHILAADEAESKLAEHQSKQATVDLKEAKQ